MTDFLKNTWERLRAFGKEAGYFLSSRVFLIDFGKMLLIIGGLLFLMFWLMKCYSGHGESVKVGAYVGKNVKEVIRWAKSDGFDIEVTDSIYREGFAADLVLEQNPLPSARVKEGRTIYLKITKAAGDLVALPDIAGRDEIGFYSQNLMMLGVKVGKIDTILDADLADGTIKQVFIRGKDVTNDLQFGTVKVPQGSAVDFVVSKRQSDEALVPPFENMTADQYDFLLSTVGLRLGAVQADPSVTNQNVAKVYKTEPEAGATIKKGTAVDIYVRE
ncbi:MAG: PASTA domain-containing protein [Saprospiraceae bacterium]|nr:PASTA domain-containing protein [Saprospiraceae bacterium]